MPLSSLEELEMLRLGVEGKAAGWRTLRSCWQVAAVPGQLDELIARAQRQSGLLEESASKPRQTSSPRPAAVIAHR